MFLGYWDRESGNVTPMGSHQKQWDSAVGRMAEDWDEGAGDGREGLSSKRESPHPEGWGKQSL